MKSRIRSGVFCFLAGAGAYGVLAGVFAVVFDGRGVSRDAPFLYPAELIVAVGIALFALIAAGRD